MTSAATRASAETRTYAPVHAFPMPVRRAAASPQVARCPTQCSSCGLREICLPCGMSGPELERLDKLVYTRRRVKRGESAFRAGDPFASLYAVRSGFFKSYVLLEDGRNQVTAFNMAGELMGMDGIGTDRHTLNAVALEDSEVCVILFTSLEAAAGEIPGLQRQIHRAMSREIVRDQGVMMLLGTMRAEERVATFLLNLSQRFTARGYSPDDFHLRMTREEMGSYIGLQLETVSRILSRFDEEGLISVQQKHLRVLDVDGLRRVIGHHLPE